VQSGHVDIAGMTVVFLASGAIQISGADRWGNRIDSVYENIDYLRNALPVLERSLTATQAMELRAVVDARQ
jgi:hypothetical protein